MSAVIDDILDREAPRLGTAGADAPAAVVARARAAQSAWAGVPIRGRLNVLRRVRHAIAERGGEFADLLAGPDRTRAQSLAAEIVPLADAIRFCERYAARVLRPVRWGRAGRPAWLSRTSVEVRREAVGVVLVIAPENYPLLLPGVQAVQALAAGNAVLVKPAPGRSGPVDRLRGIALECGLPADLFTVLDESPSAATATIDAGVDKVLFTGSAETGRRVLANLAPRATPAVMELSGCDAVFVQRTADLDLVARGLAFALSFNGGRTCVGPRRVFVSRDRVDALAARLVPLVEAQAPSRPAVPLFAEATGLIGDAVTNGARRLTGGASGGVFWPTVLADVTAEMAVARSDLFVPVISLITVDDDAGALAVNDSCPFALGAAVFGDAAGAERLAAAIPAGVVVVNDLIVPHADPRVSLAGRRASGFGATRGAEGLLELTRPKAVVVRGGRFRPHFDPPHAADEAIFADYLRAAHGRSIWSRIAAAGRVIKGLMRRGKSDGPGGSSRSP
ncbi:MAG TPA: aldehyde dehydrogenase family protein [Tepidisphaeraceae bacterium]|nr:aldehyde dehydrogenase family protein [Tepidisphaeraceae bacterium]